MDLFPRKPIDLQTNSHHGMNKSIRQDTKRAQITVMYDGKVFIFNEVSSEKAEEIIFLGKQEGNSRVYSLDNRQKAPETNRIAKPQQIESRSASTAAKQICIPSFLNNLSRDIAASMAQTSNGLPIARRKSLHRFLEKRQDRCVGFAPYHISGSLAAAVPAASQSMDRKPWLGLAP